MGAWTNPTTPRARDQVPRSRPHREHQLPRRVTTSSWAAATCSTPSSCGAPPKTGMPAGSPRCDSEMTGPGEAVATSALRRRPAHGRQGRDPRGAGAHRRLVALPQRQRGRRLGARRLSRAGPRQLRARPRGYIYGRRSRRSRRIVVRASGRSTRVCPRLGPGRALLPTYSFWYRTASAIFADGKSDQHVPAAHRRPRQAGPGHANVTGDAMKEDGTVNRAALPAVFNPEDLNALEEALRLKDRHGARVTVITMGPPAAVQVLRESLYRGADEVDPAHRQGLRRRRHAGHELRAVAGGAQAGRLRPRALRPPGDRRRHRPGGPADRREARLPADHLREPHRRARGAGGRRGRRHHRHALHRGRLRDAHLLAPLPAHGHRRGQRAAAAERQAGHDLQGHRRRGHARLRRHLPRPRERRGRGVHARPRRQARVPRQGRAVGPPRPRRRPRGARPARFAHAREGDRERRARAERGAHGGSRTKPASRRSSTS